jgi:hypothetical protein
MKRTIENCSVIMKALMNEVASHPGTEELNGKVYCQGYEGAEGDPYEKCQRCEVSIYSLEVTE